jgi:aminoglycoside phosphotransferase (APT) family kinase protein
MDDQGLPSGRITAVEPLGGGTQNVILRFERGGQSYVLRRPPEHKRANSDDVMRREARVLAALAGTDVPHAHLVAACPDVEPLGAAFYLMESIEGANPTVELPPRYRDSDAWCRQLGLAMADVAAAIGEVDHVAAGLDDLGRPKGFLERQVGRWRSQLVSYRELPGYPGPGIPDVDRVADWLEANRPATFTAGLLHGDFHFANVLCGIAEPGVVAVLDWEMTTIGDPLLDLGWLLATWPDEGGPQPGELGVRPWRGFPRPCELVARYAERSSRDLRAVSWYEVLACYKLGIVLEGTYARACAGLAPIVTGELLHRTMLRLFDRARSRIREA